MKNPFKPHQWKRKDWFYCHKSTGGKCAGVWRVHHPADCKGKAHVFNESNKEPSKKKSKNDARSLKLAKAFVAVAEGDNGNTESKEEEESEGVTVKP